MNLQIHGFSWRGFLPISRRKPELLISMFYHDAVHSINSYFANNHNKSWAAYFISCHDKSLRLKRSTGVPQSLRHEAHTCTSCRDHIKAFHKPRMKKGTGEPFQFLLRWASRLFTLFFCSNNSTMTVSCHHEKPRMLETWSKLIALSPSSFFLNFSINLLQSLSSHFKFFLMLQAHA